MATPTPNKHQNVSHPDLTSVRKERISKLKWLLEKATNDDNYGLIKKFTKEIEIQQCYLQIEEAHNAKAA